MSAHTPGPWRADYGTTREPSAMVITTGGRMAIDVAESGNTHDEDCANARLIAAAPALLAAARLLVSYGCAGVDQDTDDPTLCGKCGPCEARQLIRRVEGKS